PVWSEFHGKFHHHSSYSSNDVTWFLYIKNLQSRLVNFLYRDYDTIVVNRSISKSSGACRHEPDEEAKARRACKTALNAQKQQFEFACSRRAENEIGGGQSAFGSHPIRRGGISADDVV